MALTSSRNRVGAINANIETTDPPLSLLSTINDMQAEQTKEAAEFSDKDKGCTDSQADRSGLYSPVTNAIYRTMRIWMGFILLAGGIASIPVAVNSRFGRRVIYMAMNAYSLICLTIHWLLALKAVWALTKFEQLEEGSISLLVLVGSCWILSNTLMTTCLWISFQRKNGMKAFFDYWHDNWGTAMSQGLAEGDAYGDCCRMFFRLLQRSLVSRMVLHLAVVSVMSIISYAVDFTDPNKVVMRSLLEPLDSERFGPMSPFIAIFGLISYFSVPFLFCMWCFILGHQFTDIAVSVDALGKLAKWHNQGERTCLAALPRGEDGFLRHVARRAPPLRVDNAELDDGTITALLGRLRCEHHKLCGAVERLDITFSQMLLLLYATNLPLLCFTAYLLATASLDARSLMSTATFMFLQTYLVIIVSLYASSVNSKAHSAKDSVFGFPIKECDDPTNSIILQMNLFLFRLTGEPIGFSVASMFVITKGVLLTLSGLFLTYFILLLQMKIP